MAEKIEIVDGLDGRAASNRGEQAGEHEHTCVFIEHPDVDRRKYCKICGHLELPE